MAEKKPVDHGSNGSAQREQARHSPPFSPAAERPAGEPQPGPNRRLKAPTTVLVTLFVALLSVAVGPALARQWDDRQKAREFQVELAQLVRSTTADIQAELRSFAYSSQRDPWPVHDGIFDRWEVARLEVETKLRVYYGEQGVNAWRSYVRAVEGLGVLAAYEAGAPNGRSWQTVVTETVCYGSCSRPEPDEYVRRIARPEDTRAPTADVYIANFRGRRELLRESGLGNLSRRLADQASTVVDLIFRNRPRGFSTTRGDLLRDLLP